MLLAYFRIPLADDILCSLVVERFGFSDEVLHDLFNGDLGVYGE